MKSFILALLFIATSSFAAADRIALVIGNSKYAEFGTLANPANDARDINKALTEMGYKTRLVLDANESTIRKEFRNFASQSDSASIAVVFYAGHGAQVNGENYLLPVDMDVPKRESDIQLSALKIDDVINSIKSKTKVIFLDACRDNPALIKSLSKGRGSYRGGLAATNTTTLNDQSSGIFIAYATDAGNVASDGLSGDKNSPFTSALLRHIKQPVSIDDMFSMVTKDVRQQTKNSQKPYKYASLDGVICLSGSCSIQRNNITAQSQLNNADTVGEELPNKWVMFQVAQNPKSSVYLNPGTIKIYESRVVASQKWIREADGTYDVIDYVYDCLSYKSNVGSIKKYDPKGKKLEEFFFGDFKLMNLNIDYSDKKTIGFGSTNLICDKNAHTPIVSSKDLNSPKWIKFFKWAPDADMYYLDLPYKKSISGTVTIKIVFPRTKGSEIPKKYFIDTGVEDFNYVPYASSYVSKITIMCKEKMYYEQVANFFDDDSSLVGYLNITGTVPELASKFNITPDSPASQLSRLVCN